MAEKYFVDTNILIYAHDRSAGVKHDRARRVVTQLWNSGKGVLSTQILQEFCVNLRTKLARPLPLSEVRLLVQDYLTWEIVLNTSQSVIHALDTQMRYKTSFWDALVLHAAEHSGAEIVYSEDMSHGQRYGSVQVINPLLS
jgi:predicted nucleic acid-binding protein